MKNDLLNLIGQIIEAMRDQDAVNAELLSEIARMQDLIETIHFLVGFLMVVLMAELFRRLLIQTGEGPANRDESKPI